VVMKPTSDRFCKKIDWKYTSSVTCWGDGNSVVLYADKSLLLVVS
jgi:hypothetical protein